jgi:hypothetical protein
MRIPPQLVVATFVAVAILAVFVYPLTFGPPAPHQKNIALAALIACALVALGILLVPLVKLSVLPLIAVMGADQPPDRLALICTRLC